MAVHLISIHFQNQDLSNLLDFLHVDYHPIAQMLIDITAGCNGHGASELSRCDFLYLLKATLNLASQPKVVRSQV